MNRVIPLAIAALLSLAPLACALQDARRDPIDGMPRRDFQPAIRTQRTIERLQRQLAAARHQSASPDRMKMQLELGDAWLLLGHSAEAGTAYASALRDSLHLISPAPQKVPGSYLICLRVIHAAKLTQHAGLRNISLQLGKNALCALCSYQQSAPEWEPQIIAARVEDVQHLLTSLR